MQVNYLVKDLIEYLPHRPPMVWIHEVVSMGEEQGYFMGTCRALLNQPSLFLGEDGRIRGSAAIELTAQAYGYARACFHVVNDIDDTPRLTYLTGVRHCETFFEGFMLDSHPELFIEVQVTRKMPKLTFIEGTVLGKDDTLFARTELQVYTV